MTGSNPWLPFFDLRGCTYSVLCQLESTPTWEQSSELIIPLDDVPPEYRQGCGVLQMKSRVSTTTRSQGVSDSLSKEQNRCHSPGGVPNQLCRVKRILCISFWLFLIPEDSLRCQKYLSIVYCAVVKKVIDKQFVVQWCRCKLTSENGILPMVFVYNYPRYSVRRVGRAWRKTRDPR